MGALVGGSHLPLRQDDSGNTTHDSVAKTPASRLPCLEGIL
jgi:hypothetical protein